MPTSDFNVTREELVRRALRKLGATNPSTEDLTNAVQSLNVLVKEIDPQGKWLWTITNTESTLTISASTRTYTTGSGAGNIATDILALETFILLKGTTRVPCRILEKKEALSTYELEGTGEPYLVYLEKKPLAANNVLWTYPLPSGSYTAKYTYRRRLYDFDAAGDNPDFPQEWINCLTYVVADDLADEYGLPLEERDRLSAKAAAKLRSMKIANAENPSTDVTTPTQYF